MNWLYLKLSKTSLVAKLLRAPVPSWTILIMDLLIILGSCSILLVSDIFQNGVISPDVPVKVACIVGVFTFMDIITRNYQCIIRLSVMEDMSRILSTSIGSVIIMFIINFIIDITKDGEFFSYWNIVFIGFIDFTLLLTSRLTLKYLYVKISNSGLKLKRIIILGADGPSVKLVNALRNESSGKFEPIALLSLNSLKHISSINGTPVVSYSPDKVAAIFKKYDCDSLVLPASHTKLMNDELAGVFLKNNIKILIQNQVTEFNTKDNINNHPINSSQIKNIQIEDLLGRNPITYDNAIVKSNIKDRCVLITGAAGSIGSEIVRQVAIFGARKIVLLDQAETPMHDMFLEMKEKFPNVAIELFIGDVTNKTRMELVFKKFRPYFVFHAAAYKHVPMMEINPSEAILTNVLGTRNIADLSLKYGVYKFVMISTDKAVNPTNIMGTTKRIAEIYVQSLFFNSLSKSAENNHTQFITTRFGNVLGSNGSVIPIFRRQIEKGGPVTVTHRDIIRYFMTIPEACSLVLEAGCMGKGGEIYIFDMGKPVRIYDLASRMISLAGLRVNEDIKIIETGLRPGEKLYEELLNDKERTQSTQNDKIMIAKVQRYNYDEIYDKIESIISFAQKGNIHDLVWQMKCLVPEYKSMNSCEFEKIDKELADNKKELQLNPTLNNN